MIDREASIARRPAEANGHHERNTDMEVDEEP